MLDFITKHKERKTQKQVEAYIDDGLTKITNKLYKQGLICFNNAIELNADFVVEKLLIQFKSYYQMGDWDSALSIGSAVLQVNKNDYELANKVGNCARKLHNFQQANNLYRLSLRSNKKYREAYYNLAASMGKVNIFDLDIKFTIEKYISDNDYILPDYLNDSDFVDNFKASLIKTYQKRIKKEIELEAEAGQKVHKAIIQDYVPNYDEILAEIEVNVEKLSEDLESEKKQEIYHNIVYNKGLYALENMDFETSFNAFILLKQANKDLEYLDMLLALILSRRDKTDQAVDMMIRLLGQDQHNRFLNVNLGIMYKKMGNHLLSTKYLAVGAFLLQKSDGMYKISDLMNIAIDNFDNGSNRKALTLFKIIISEQNNIRAWTYIGEIYLLLKNYNDAVKTFKEIIKIDPKSDLGHSKLKDIHDLFYEKGINNQIEKKSRTAVGFYVKAFKVVESIETLEKIVELFTKLKDLEQAQTYQNRLDVIKQKDKDERLEKFRQDYIRRGKIFVKNRKFDEAIQNLEQAFRMKVDKDVFMYLAHIYKRLNKTKSLANLLQRWESMQDMEEKIKQRERGLARTKRSENL